VIINKLPERMSFVAPTVDTNGQPIDPALLGYRMYIDGVSRVLHGPNVAVQDPVDPARWSLPVGVYLSDVEGTYQITFAAIMDGVEGAQSLPVAATVVFVPQTPAAPADVQPV
jgi:hypothetical protein